MLRKKRLAILLLAVIGSAVLAGFVLSLPGRLSPMERNQQQTEEAPVEANETVEEATPDQPDKPIREAPNQPPQPADPEAPISQKPDPQDEPPAEAPPEAEPEQPEPEDPELKRPEPAKPLEIRVVQEGKAFTPDTWYLFQIAPFKYVDLVFLRCDPRGNSYDCQLAIHLELIVNLEEIKLPGLMVDLHPPCWGIQSEFAELFAGDKRWPAKPETSAAFRTDTAILDCYSEITEGDVAMSLFNFKIPATDLEGLTHLNLKLQTPVPTRVYNLPVSDWP